MSHHSPVFTGKLRLGFAVLMVSMSACSHAANCTLPCPKFAKLDVSACQCMPKSNMGGAGDATESEDAGDMNASGGAGSRP